MGFPVSPPPVRAGGPPLTPTTRLSASVATHAILIAAASEGAPIDWVQLLPFGAIRGRDGRAWTMARGRAATVIAASINRAAGADLVVDYDHQADFAAVAGVGGRAPASGWIKQLEARDDGIYGRIEWTAAAAQALRDGEYRYISPVFQHTKAGDVLAILRAGLTNTPNLELAAVASEQSNPGDIMDLSKLAQALGLGPDATEEQILAAIGQLTAGGATATASELNKIAVAVGLKDGASTDAIVTAISARATGGEAIIALQTQLNQVIADRDERDAVARTDAAVLAGKVVPAAYDQFLALARTDPARFDGIVGAQPVVIDPTLRTGREKIDPSTVALTAEDVAVCNQMGLDQAAYLETKKKELA